MAKRQQMRPASKEQAPDPSDSYERAHPEHEAGMGSLDNITATPTDRPNQQKKAVTNKQPPRQVNAEEITDARKSASPTEQQPVGQQPDHSMHEEEPLGWDQAPSDIKDPRKKRHPRTEGRGGVK